MRYIQTLETSRIQKDYEDVLAYSQRSTDLLYTMYGDELYQYSNEEAKEKSPLFFTATGLYLMGLNYQIIAYCCLYDLTQNVKYLHLAYSVLPSEGCQCPKRAASSSRNGYRKGEEETKV